MDHIREFIGLTGLAGMLWLAAWFLQLKGLGLSDPPDDYVIRTNRFVSLLFTPGLARDRLLFRPALMQTFAIVMIIAGLISRYIFGYSDAYKVILFYGFGGALVFGAILSVLIGWYKHRQP